MRKKYAYIHPHEYRGAKMHTANKNNRMKLNTDNLNFNNNRNVKKTC